MEDLMVAKLDLLREKRFQLADAPLGKLPGCHPVRTGVSNAVGIEAKVSEEMGRFPSREPTRPGGLTPDYPGIVCTDYQSWWSYPGLPWCTKRSCSLVLYRF